MKPRKKKKSLLAQVRATCGKAQSALDRCVDRVASTLDEPGSEYDRDMASHLVWLAKNLSQMAGELRKIEAAEAKLADIDPAQVLEWCRRQTPVSRAQLISELQAMDARKSVL